MKAFGMALLLSLLAVIMTVNHGYAQEVEEEMNNSVEKAEILQRIELYCCSIVNAGDLTIAEQVWATTPASSFIHPRGHEFGWEEIKSNFYIKTMAKTFSQRELKLKGNPVVHIYDKCAVAEFDWDFVATMIDGSTKHTVGRESQIYINMPGSGWRLVHVHYSGPPTTARGEGF